MSVWRLLVAIPDLNTAMLINAHLVMDGAEGWSVVRYSVLTAILIAAAVFAIGWRR